MGRDGYQPAVYDPKLRHVSLAEVQQKPVPKSGSSYVKGYDGCIYVGKTANGIDVYRAPLGSTKCLTEGKGSSLRTG